MTFSSYKHAVEKLSILPNKAKSDSPVLKALKHTALRKTVTSLFLIKKTSQAHGKGTEKGRFSPFSVPSKQ
jgi:hypothetical protein